MGPTSESRTVDARRARAERILDAAGELMLRWGFKRVTIEDVAEHAQIGKGTIYLHWKNRHSLFRAVLLRAMLEIVEDLEAAVQADPEVALPHTLMREVYLALMRRPLMRAVFVADRQVLGSLADEEAPRDAQQRIAASKDSIRLARDLGILRRDLSFEELRYTISSLVGGFFVTAGQEGDEFPSTTRRGDLLALAVQGAVEHAAPPAAAAVGELAAGTLRFFAVFKESAHATLQQAYD